MKWTLCCLCQEDNKDEPLRNPTKEGLLGVEKDQEAFKELVIAPFEKCVSLDKLDEGTGIANCHKDWLQI